MASETLSLDSGSCFGKISWYLYPALMTLNALFVNFYCLNRSSVLISWFDTFLNIQSLQIRDSGFSPSQKWSHLQIVAVFQISRTIYLRVQDCEG